MPDISSFLMKQKSNSIFAGFLCSTIAGLLTLGTHSQPIPPFKMTVAGNKVFDIKTLLKGKPLILIYFDPDCDHCQKLMDDIFKNINEFKKAEMVMATFKPVSELAAFDKKYKASKYPNIKVGSETTTYYLRLYYGVTTLPFTALYDKKGNLNFTYREETPVSDLIRRVKEL